MRGSSCITMEFFNVFRGLKKSSSETKLGDRLSFSRRSKSGGGRKSSIDSPLPPRPGKGRGGVERTIIENIAEDQVTGPSLHSPRRDTDQFGNVYNKYESLVIRGKVHLTGDSWTESPAILLISDISDDSGSCSPAPGGGPCCPSCGLAYDSGKRRVLVDSCGHERCYQCLFSTEDCPQCPVGQMMASPAMSVRSLEPGVVYGSVGGPGVSSRIFPTPPVSRRPGQYRPSPGPAGRRPNWIQRYNRRPNTVNIDDKSMSGKCHLLSLLSSQTS